jgi:hypothetical protein
MQSHEGNSTLVSIVVCALAIGVFLAPVSLRAGQPADLARQIETKLSSVQRQTVTAPTQAEKDLLAARDLLGQLKTASANHEKLPALQKRFDDLKEKLEKRLGRPVGGSAEAPKQEAAPAQSQATASELPSAVVSQLKKLDTALTAATASLEKNQLQTANRRLDEAKKVMSEIQTRYGAKIPAGNAQMTTAAERLNAIAAKISDANANAAAIAAGQAAAKEKMEAQSKEWMAKLRPFFDYKSDLYLRMGSEFNNASPEEQQKARQAYAKANELLPTYQATEFPNGKTQELEYIEQRLMGYLTIYNEDEARSKQEESCRKWVDAFRPYVEVGAGSPKYLVVGVTVDQDEITKRAALLEEAKTLWQSYEGGGEFPHGKSRELLALEEQMQQRLAEMPEALRQSRALVSADVDKEFTRVLDYLTADTGWKEDLSKKPNLVMERDLVPLREALQQFAAMAGADAGKLATLRETMGKIEQQDQANRALRAERTYMEPDQYEGDDADSLRRKAGEIVKEKVAQAQVLRTTLPAEDWKQESVVEWTDTTRTALRYRNTRLMTAHVAAKGADGKVYLHAVHLASDRQSDGSWGLLYGHIMWSDWMAEKNVNEDPPSP